MRIIIQFYFYLKKKIFFDNTQDLTCFIKKGIDTHKLSQQKSTKHVHLINLLFRQYIRISVLMTIMS